MIDPDPTWLSDERIREIKHGDDCTRPEALALCGEVRERRRADAKQEQLFEWSDLASLAVIGLVLLVLIKWIVGMLAVGNNANG